MICGRLGGRLGDEIWKNVRVVRISGASNTFHGIRHNMLITWEPYMWEFLQEKEVLGTKRP